MAPFIERLTRVAKHSLLETAPIPTSRTWSLGWNAMATRSFPSDLSSARPARLGASWQSGLQAVLLRVRAGLVNAINARRTPPLSAAAPSAPLGVDAVAALIAQLMASSSWQMRVAAAMSLSHVQAEGVVEALVRALRDPSLEVGVAAADALAQHGVTLSVTDRGVHCVV
jgi:hypothetical protein